MTDYTPILHLPEVAPNQDQKEATINTAIAILEAAMNDTLAVSVLAGDVTLNQDQFTKWFLFQAQGAVAPATRTVTVPQTQRWFAVENQTDTTITVTTGVVSALDVDIPSGKIALIVSDGSDLRAVIPDPVNGVGLLQDLANVTGVPTDGQLLRWIAADGQWEPWTFTLSYAQLTGKPVIPTNLGHLADVEDATGTPVQGSFLRWIDGVWQADFVDLSHFGGGGGTTPGATALADLTDVTVGTPVDGQVLTWVEADDKWEPRTFSGSGGPVALAGLSDVTVPAPSNGAQLIYNHALGKWTAGSIWEGLPGSAAGFGAHLYWRLNITANNGSSRVAVGELEFRESIGGSDQASGGTAFDDLHFLSFVPDNAFANDGGTTFWVGGGPTGILGYQFDTPVAIAQIALTTRGDGFLTDAPQDFAVEYSDDNVTWTTAWSIAGETAWTAGETRLYAASNAGSNGPTLNLMWDVGYPAAPADKQVLTWNQATAQWEPKTVSVPWANITGAPMIPTKLGQLADVEDGTGTPAQGAFLRWIDGAWQADPFQVPFIPRKLGQLADVEDATGTPPQGSFLRWIDGVWQADLFQVPFIPQTLGQLADVEAGTGTPAQGAYLRYVDGVWQADPGTTAVPFSVVISKSGKLSNNQMLAAVPIDSQVTFADDFAGSSFYCKTNPTATTVFAVMRVVSGIASQIGLISINTSGVATFSTTATGVETFNAGNILRIDGPATADASLADFGLTLKGARIL